MKDIKKKLKSLIPSKRKLIQLYSALLFNANIKGFFTGEIYKGSSKSMCAPGLNCYSCPGAVGACPLGSLQNALGSQPHSAAFYVIGILLLYGLLLGRFICGFLCPFGLIQELLYKIKTPKLKKSKVTRLLSYLKYLILGYFVIIIPVFYILYSEFGNAVPGFCKYICPAGTLEGALGLLLQTSRIFPTSVRYSPGNSACSWQLLSAQSLFSDFSAALFVRLAQFTVFSITLRFSASSLKRASVPTAVFVSANVRWISATLTTTNV